jgi:hypothetical protein
MQDCNSKVSNSLSTPFERKSNIPQYKTQTLDATRSPSQPNDLFVGGSLRFSSVSN